MGRLTEAETRPEGSSESGVTLASSGAAHAEGAAGDQPKVRGAERVRDLGQTIAPSSKTTLPPTMVVFARPVSFLPCHGELRLFDWPWVAS